MSKDTGSRNNMPHDPNLETAHEEPELELPLPAKDLPFPTADEQSLSRALLSVALITRALEVVKVEKGAANTSLETLSSQIAPLKLSTPGPTPTSSPLITSKLPKNTLKALCAKFKAMTTANAASDPHRRAFLAFYAQLLQAEENDVEKWLELSRSAQQLLVSFLSCAGRECMRSAEADGNNNQNITAIVNEHASAFIDLLLDVLKTLRASGALYKELESYRTSLQSTQSVLAAPPGINSSLISQRRRSSTQSLTALIPTVSHSSSTSTKVLILDEISLTNMELLAEIAKLLHRSKAALEAEAHKIKSEAFYSTRQLYQQIDTHPLYDMTDFETADEFDLVTREEMQRIADTLDDLNKFEDSHSDVNSELVYGDGARPYLYSLLIEALEDSTGSGVLLTRQCRTLIRACMQVWLLSAECGAAILLRAVADRYRARKIEATEMHDVFSYVKFLVNDKSLSNWPRKDRVIAENALQSMERTSVFITIMPELADLAYSDPTTSTLPKIKPLGPVLQLMEEELLPYISETELEDQKAMLKAVLAHAAEDAYHQALSKLPRDATLELDHLTLLIRALKARAKLLSSKYRNLLLGILIPNEILARYKDCLAADSMSIIQFCESVLKAEGQTFEYEEFSPLHKEIMEFVPDILDSAESLLISHVVAWATTACTLTEKWVVESVVRDTFEAIAPDEDKWHSTSVQDLFATFASTQHSFETLKWRSSSHSAMIYTHLASGLGSCLTTWLTLVRQLFAKDLEELAEADTAPVAAPAPALPPSQPVSQQSYWLARAKEAVQPLTAAAAQAADYAQAAISAPAPPEPTQFKTATCVRLNDIAAAQTKLLAIEESLQTDEIARLFAHAKASEQQLPSYLWTVHIIEGSGLHSSSNGNINAYATLLVQPGPKVIGRTHSVKSHRPSWDRAFEFETSSGAPAMGKILVWNEQNKSAHELLGSTHLKFDPRDFQGKSYGSVKMNLVLGRGSVGHTRASDSHRSGGVGSMGSPSKGGTSSNPRISVLLSFEERRFDIRFFFGRMLRALDRAQNDMLTSIAQQLLPYLKTYISLNTVHSLSNTGSMSVVNSWLGRASATPNKLSPASIGDSLQPLFDYLNANFEMIATSLAPPLRIAAMLQTWTLVLTRFEKLILPPTDVRIINKRQPLTSVEMEIVYIWLALLRDFFHNNGAGPELESLHTLSYQKIMTIPVYYDLSIPRLRQECEKFTESSMEATSKREEVLQRSGSVMTHRNRRVKESQKREQRLIEQAIPQDDQIILAILRLRHDDEFVERYLEFRARLEVKKSTERSLRNLQRAN